MKKKLSLSLAMAAAALVGGCFGGGDDMPEPAPPPAPAPDPLAAVPDSAKQSTDGLVSYLKVLNANASDTREPLDLSMVTLPQDDTSEPAPI